jgi:hypothetical protein
LTEQKNEIIEKKGSENIDLEDPMDLEEIMFELRKLEANESKNKTEPLAAHSILPLVSALSQYLYDKEAEEQENESTPMEESAKREGLPPQVGYLSLPLIMSLREHLKENLYNMLFNLQIESLEGEGTEAEEDEDLQKAKLLFLSLESEIQRQPLEVVAGYWLGEFAETMKDDLEEYRAEMGIVEEVIAQTVVESPPGNNVDVQGGSGDYIAALPPGQERIEDNGEPITKEVPAVVPDPEPDPEPDPKMEDSNEPSSPEEAA